MSRHDYRHRRTPGRRALTALHVSLMVMCVFAVAVLGIVVFPEGRELVADNFGMLRAGSYLAWAAGFAGFVLAPALLLRELGVIGRLTLRPNRLRTAFDLVGAPSVGRAFAFGALANALVLALSPLGLAVGEHYSWSVFCAHLIVSAVVVAASSLGALVRLRDFVSELQPLPVPHRASHAAPAGGV